VKFHFLFLCISESLIQGKFLQVWDVIWYCSDMP